METGENGRLNGCIDFHVHASPDVKERALNYLDLARNCIQAGMAGVVVKSHDTATSDMAELVSREFPNFRMIGGVTLNRAVGGFNPDAVRSSFALGGRFVWFPSRDAANDLCHQGRDGVKGLSPLDDRKRVRDDVREILDIVAEHDGILCSSHLAPDETHVVFERARKAGVRRLVVTHPEHVCVDFPLSDQVDLARTGVFFERAFPRENMTTDIPGIVACIRATGVVQNVIGTDLGRSDLPDPVTGFAQLLYGLKDAGMTDREVHHMSAVLPAHILDSPRPEELPRV